MLWSTEVSIATDRRRPDGSNPCRHVERYREKRRGWTNLRVSPEQAFGDEVQLGLIAQDVERVLPDLVAEGDDGFKRVRYSDLPIYLLQALKEQQLENGALQESVSDLSERLRALEN